jgi:chemotaxis protein methyltransferase CheR
MNMSLSHAEFVQIRDHVRRTSGIVIGDEKISMVVSRLWRHVEKLGFNDFGSYLRHLQTAAGADSKAQMLDLLTTNETYFFREPAHFKLLREQILPQLAQREGKQYVPRVWCAAASSGEEPYSLAMVLAEKFGLQGWQLLATDISANVLEKASRGMYRMERIENMPDEYMKRYCRRGIDQYDGWFMLDRCLRARITFAQHNLLQKAAPEFLSAVQPPTATDTLFDVIFLRNVLIYFDQPTKQRVLEHLVSVLRPGGWLITGHCESLNGLTLPLQQQSPSIHRHFPAVSTTSQRLPA